MEADAEALDPEALAVFEAVPLDSEPELALGVAVADAVLGFVPVSDGD